MDKSFEKLINRVLDGRYRIESVVGIGGMAYVLRAADMQNANRPVAIKVLNEEFNRDENAVKRFINESETIAMVDSPNIVKIYDVAMSESLKYIVMEFIDGITLKDYIDKVGALGWKEAVHYVRQILTGLAHAHEKGIIHRDIKPQNVMLLRDGKVKVTDFGIAKSPTSENLTMTDKAIGTVNYISPEQASGEPVDKKSDVYSVGIMLYEMLTGKLPFTAESPVAVAMMQVNDTPVPPRELNPQIPVGLEQIILKAMSKKPEERFNCASSMEKALEYFVKNPATVFAATSASDTVNVKKRKAEADETNHRSMLPIIMGVTASFLVVVMCVLFGYVIPKTGSTLKGVGEGKENWFVAFVDGLLGVENTNSNENKMKVADFTGSIYNEEVIRDMESRGYYVKSVMKTGYANVENGMIVNQKPEAGQIIIKQDSVGITLYVNENIGETSKSMPDCVGISQNSAIEQIVRKFGPDVTREDIQIIEEFNESHAAGTVYDCIPEVGDEVDVETTSFILYISKGKKMRMPDVIDKTENEARALLDAEGINFTVEYEESDAEVGIVLDSSVGYGLEVFASDTVVLTVSKKSFKRHENNEENTEENNEVPENSEVENTPSGGNEASSNEPVVTTPNVDNQESGQTEEVPSTEKTPSKKPSGNDGVGSLLDMREGN